MLLYIEQVADQKFLGVWFSEELTWSTHINRLKTELSRVIGIIYKMQNVIPTWLKMTLYYSLFYSKISYGILVWSMTTASNYNKVIILQKKILRICENYRGNIRNLSTQTLFVKYNILKADQTYHFKLFQWIYKNNLYLTQTPPSSAYTLRDPKRRIPSIRTNYGRQSLSYMSTKLLNSPGIDVNFSSPFPKFKKDCRGALVCSDIAFSPI